MRLKKSKWIKVIKFKSTKKVEVRYYQDDKLPKTIQIDPDHVFIDNGYRTILITDKSIQSIDPLDFESKYDADHFKSAIESKLIQETFAGLEKPKLDLVKMLLFVVLGVLVLLVFYIMKKDGVI